MNNYAQYLLKTQLHMEEMWLPLGSPPPLRCNIFLSPNIRACETLVLLIQGTGDVRAGIWSRSLASQVGLSQGSMIPYLRAIEREGWGCVCFNPNEIHIGGEPITPIQSDERHVQYVWTHVVKGTILRENPGIKHLLIISHSRGGTLTTKLLEGNSRDILPLLRGVAMLDSAHKDWPSRTLPPALFQTLQRFWTGPLVCNWKRNATAPVDTPLPAGNKGCTCLSAGTPEHVRTVNVPFDSAFHFLRQCLDRARRSGPPPGVRPPPPPHKR
ncbi:putative argonaute binding protein 2 [Paratrimastix pyriformis]|uniref:Argonaute binding protein 2 n=1 Tax=Paratrimastix pyriformis TaxID=342808 RepID=A0ABQ8UPY2_9EUKA|nr:putative argonaute binding protein 2 [Paratrimastix pyriformis]